MLDGMQNVGWIWQRVRDLPASVDFYTRVVGLPLLERGDDRATVWLGETTRLWLIAGGPALPVYGHAFQSGFTPVIRCRDIGRVRKRVVEDAGAPVIREATPDHHPGGHIVYVRDPSGYVLGLQQRFVAMREEDYEAFRRADGHLNDVPGLAPMPDEIVSLGWIVLRPADGDAARAFWSDVLRLGTPARGAVRLPDGSTAQMFHAGEALMIEVGDRTVPTLEAAPYDRAAPAPVSSWSEAPTGAIFRAHGIDTLITRLREAGVRIMQAPRDEPAGRMAFFLDPEGRPFGLLEPAEDHPVERAAARRWEERRPEDEAFLAGPGAA
jgi:predicted enzyme related to lactoylglutathione lyase